MLVELSIKNFAIIDDISITFNEGLTVLTGETGAGKSIIIDAVQLLTGSRGSVEFVRHGEKKAEIIGLFSVDENAEIIEHKCNLYGIDIEENMLTLERTITSKGKSICRINGKIITLGILKEFGEVLLNIHSQHDTIHLMDSRTHILLLDTYKIQEILPTKQQYTSEYNELVTLQQKYKQLSENEQQISHRLDLLTFQLNEIEQAELEIDEDIKLTEIRDQMQNYEKIHQSVTNAYHALYGERKGLEYVNVALTSLEEGKSIDPFIQKQSAMITDIFYNLEEMSFELSRFSESLAYDEGKLNEMESRLNDINRLKRKYGNSVNEILKYKDKIAIEIDEIENKESHLEALEYDIEQATDKARVTAEALQKIRKKIALQLTHAIKTELADLYLENTTFHIQFNETERLNKNGIDDIVFLLSTNKGEPLKEIRKVASGGELSRIMLALKKIFAKHDKISTVIFDEIDTGVSGRVAQAIAEKMYDIANSTQVLCITHLAQVAAMSDYHLYIAKSIKDERATTDITELSLDDRINALGEMITGTELTATAIEHAEHLLQFSTELKSK